MTYFFSVILFYIFAMKPVTPVPLHSSPSTHLNVSEAQLPVGTNAALYIYV
jgi:hypothetical protein